MKEYLLSLFSASLLITLAGILAPNATTSHVKLIGALVFLCILAAPLPKVLEALPDLVGDFTTEMEGEASEEEYREQANEALQGASKTYLAQLLTERLEQEFSIPSGEVRCAILWEEGEEPYPKKVTVILSGSAIWKNPNEIEDAVTALLGCPCVTAIEAS